MSGRSERRVGPWITIALATVLVDHTRTAPGQTLRPEQAAAEASLQDRFLAGLRERRLFDLAEDDCRLRLADEGLSETRRHELTCAWSQVCLEHALHSAPLDRETHWRRAIEICDEFARKSPGRTGLAAVHAQKGLVLLARGELARQEAELTSEDAQNFETARGEIREAIATLRSATDEVAEQARLANRKNDSGADGWTAFEWSNLERNMSFQLARAYRNQGQCYPPGSDDRVSSLVRAKELLAPLAAFEGDDAIAWRSRLDEIACFRLLADTQSAMAKIQTLTEANPPAKIKLGIRAERIRLAIDAGKPEAAMAIVDDGLSEGGERLADCDFAAVEACLAGWRRATRANDTATAARLQERAAAITREMDKRWGKYWTRRAETLLAESVTTVDGAGQGSENPAVLVRAAEGFFRADRFQDAIAAYDRARLAAEQAGARESAFTAGLTAAAIVERKLADPGEAALRMRNLAIGLPEQSSAASVHLQAIYLEGRAEADTSNALDRDTVSRQLEWLDEHLAKWPGDETTGQARIWLGESRRRRKEWEAAVSAYEGMATDHSLYPRSLEDRAIVYRQWLAELAERSQPTDEVAIRAAQSFERDVLGQENSLPESWTDAKRLAAVLASEFWLTRFEDRFDRAERLLAAVIESDPSPDPDDSATAASDATETAASPFEGLRSRAVIWRVFALAGLQRVDEASRALEEVSSSAPEKLPALIDGISRISVQATPELRAQLANLQLQAAARLPPGSPGLGEADARKLQLSIAKALLVAGRRDEGLQKLESLSKEAPNEGALQIEFATALAAEEDPAAQKAALAKWREIAKRSRPGSERWFLATLGQVEVHVRLGEADAAKRLIAFAKSSRSDLGGPELAARFRDVERKLGEKKPAP